MELYQYLLPIVPNPNEYIVSLIRMIVPAILAYRLYLFFKKEHDEFVERDYRKRRVGNLIIPTLLVLVIVYFTSGYFHFYAIAIASGSMTPNINKGDVVVIEKVDDNYEDIEIGQVVAYKYDNVIIVHRLVKKIKHENEYYFYTKGDANENIDNYLITQDMIVGVVNVRIPYIGIPTVWVNAK